MKKEKELKTLLLIAIITTIIASCFTFASFNTKLAGLGKGIIASFAIDINENNEILVPLEPLAPNDEQTLNFIIYNKKNNNNSEVTMKYYLQFENSFNNLPITLLLYKKNEENTYEQIQILDTKTEQFYLNYNENNKDEYKLSIIWDKSDENYNDYKYSNSIDAIKINVISEQVD